MTLNERYTPKGLATVAVLKTRLEERQDHLSLFEPFVVDAVLHISGRDFIASDIREIVLERSGLALPTTTVQTLLARLQKQKVLVRDAGRYFRSEVAPRDPGLDAARTEAMAEQAHLGDQLRSYAAEEGVTLTSTEHALTALATFVSDFKVQLVLERGVPESPLDRSSQDRRLTRVIARFIANRCLQSETLRKTLDNLVEGIILEDTLLLRDIELARRRFDDLTVILDTPVLFSAIGLKGAANEVATVEGLHLLREAGGRTIAFDRSVGEMRRILLVYEKKVASSQGRLELYPTELTRHILKQGLTTSDIRIIGSTLEARLAKVGVVIKALPKHDRRFTLDEKLLGSRLASDADGDEEAPRVRHDVDCIAATLTLRRGRTTSSFERSEAVFASTSGNVIRTVQSWYAQQNEGGVPPAIHLNALTSIAWLKKPTAAPDVKIHELAATCIAVLRPTRKTWNRVVVALENLENQNVITTDELAALVMSELVEQELADLDDDLDPDSDSIKDALERVRDTYRREAHEEADSKVRVVLTEMDRVRHNAKEAVDAAMSESSLALNSARSANAERARLLERLRTKSEKWASVIASSVYGLGCGLLAVSYLLASPAFWPDKSEATQRIALALSILVTIYGLIRAMRGGNLLAIRNSMRDRLTERLIEAWTVDETDRQFPSIFKHDRTDDPG